MAKLDPDNWKSAKDVMDERANAALKRKRDVDDVDDKEGEVGILRIQLNPRQRWFSGELRTHCLSQSERAHILRKRETYTI